MQKSMVGDEHQGGAIPVACMGSAAKFASSLHSQPDCILVTLKYGALHAPACKPNLMCWDYDSRYQQPIQAVQLLQLPWITPNKLWLLEAHVSYLWLKVGLMAKCTVVALQHVPLGSRHMHCTHVHVTETLTLVSLPPLATSGSEVHMPRANAAVSVCPTNSKSGELAVLSCMCQVQLTPSALRTAVQACVLPLCVHFVWELPWVLGLAWQTGNGS